MKLLKKQPKSDFIAEPVFCGCVGCKLYRTAQSPKEFCIECGGFLSRPRGDIGVAYGIGNLPINTGRLSYYVAQTKDDLLCMLLYSGQCWEIVDVRI